MKFRAILFYSLLSISSIAQPVVQISNPSKLPAKTGKFKLIGKNNDGIILRPALAAAADENRADATVTGRVVDEKGAGLPGVNVVIKGGSNS